MEKDRVLVLSVEKLYKAEMVKDKLAEADVVCDIINKKGSAFLLGEIEVYVHKEDETKALDIIKQFDF